MLCIRSNKATCVAQELEADVVAANSGTIGTGKHGQLGHSLTSTGMLLHDTMH